MALTNQLAMNEVTNAADHRNNLTALRWFAACLVLYGHAFVFLGLPEPLFLQWVPMGQLGVYIFFAISGYLVAQSWQRDPSVPRFLAKRALRIFPGLLVCTLLSVLVLGPLLTTLDMATYWRNEHTLGYFTNLALYITYHLPGVFAQNKLPHAVNGSLWSLPVEFFMYLLLALLGLCAAWFQKTNSDDQTIQEPSKFSQGLTAMATVCLMGLTALWAWPSTDAWVFYRTDLRQIPLCGVYFMVGASLFQFKLNKYFSLSNVVLAVVLWLCLSREPQVFAMASWVVLPFVVLAFGLGCHTWLSRWHARDYSYGIYIYAFPVQQTWVSFWPQMPLWAYLLCTFVTTVALAALSWHFVERPSLKFKPFR
ncbi:MAG: acyltransferase [Limnohabitans sp.]|nr:acyltransferase [Limnohabitans sp.]